MTKLALVIGATGGVGGAVAERLVAEGWRVRAMNRDPDAARVGRETLEWVKGDAMIEADVVAAAEGVSLIVHGANPPGYRNWAGLQLPMLSATIAAAKASGARIVFPGTVYNYGPDAFPSIDEAAPQTPISRKGAIRVQMEQALLQAAADGVKVLIVRAGDFFGPKPGNNWFSQGLVKPGKPIAAVSYPGPLSIPHCWAYLPDLAETMVRLATNSEGLADFETFHMQGQTLTGEALVEALSHAAGRKLTAHRLPWIAIKAMSPFNETMREMLEMRYLWERPVLLDNSKLVARLGAEPRTPIVEALKTALAGIDALPRPTLKLAA
ncbi:MAG: NAD-dependent epimerase/dehydratase family protein [Phenylobacterium sp.]